ncbi:MAG: hypothetical protein QNL03_03295 [Gammaproteobacteria bacterium]|nr:hypothetical protein [Gammaproteobacteria bacterium]
MNLQPSVVGDRKSSLLLDAMYRFTFYREQRLERGLKLIKDLAPVIGKIHQDSVVIFMLTDHPATTTSIAGINRS